MRNLTVTYILALTIIAVVVIISQYLVQQSIDNSRYDSRTINISGRQSMLSQKITKAALAMETAQSKEEFQSAKAELSEAGELWEVSHNALQYGSESMQLDNVNNSEKTFLLFLDLEPHYQAIKNSIATL
jgi:hypothetical protein